MKKLYILLASFIIVCVLSSSIITNAATFSDTGTVPWAEAAINRLADQGVLNGVGNGKFDPTSNVTRGQLACIIVRAFNLPQAVGVEFPDVKTGTYYHDDIMTARVDGIITGYPEGKFYPDQNVTRQDLFVMVARAVSGRIQYQVQHLMK